MRVKSGKNNEKDWGYLNLAKKYENKLMLVKTGNNENEKNGCE